MRAHTPHTPHTPTRSTAASDHRAGVCFRRRGLELPRVRLGLDHVRISRSDRTENKARLLGAGEETGGKEDNEALIQFGGRKQSLDLGTIPGFCFTADKTAARGPRAAPSTIGSAR